MVASLNEINIRKCVVCYQGNHSFFKCPRFQKINLQERIYFVKKHSLSLNCLSEFHSVKNITLHFRVQIAINATIYSFVLIGEKEIPVRWEKIKVRDSFFTKNVL